MKYLMRLSHVCQKAVCSTVIICLSIISICSASCTPDEDIQLSLDKTGLTIAVGESVQLKATVAHNKGKEDTGSFRYWGSSNKKVAAVENGLVTALSPGEAMITYYFDGASVFCYVSVVNSSKTINGFTYEEMGDGLKWATMNVGAQSPIEIGDYFAWGETEPYYSSLNPLVWKTGKEEGYDLSSYKFKSNSVNSFTKYDRFSDNKTVLELSDDAARANWGGTWRMPTNEEWKKLEDPEQFSWIITTNYLGTGVSGFIVTSRIPGYEGNQIFLPSVREFEGSEIGKRVYYGYYWSSSLDHYNSSFALILGRTEHSTQYIEYDYSKKRFIGLAVRPVSE